MARLLTFDGKGIYCPIADVHIDPWRKVKKALITHAHSDHARRGMGSYISTKDTAVILKHRLGKKIEVYGLEYAEKLLINGVEFSFHPAGHVIGSAQIKVSYQGEIWVVSGDYKLQNDGISGQFYPVKCHSYITESTFGLPIYNWQDQALVFNKINHWWNQNKEDGIVSFLTAYSLGKAQRILQNIDHSIGKVFTHESVEKTNETIRQHGIKLKPSILASPDIDPKEYKGSLIISPSSAINSSWSTKIKDYKIASASGWLNSKSSRKRRGIDKGFVLSDHADWKELNESVKASCADEIFVTHGFSDTFSEWLKTQGYDAKVVKTAFEGEKQDVLKVEQST